MAILGGAALAVWLECLPEAEGDFDRWYRQEHLAERVGLPGFLRGRRGVALRGAPRYFAFYEADGVEVFRSAAYLERQGNPTALTRQIMPRVRSFTRGVYRRRHSVRGSAEPSLVPTLVTLRLAAEAGSEASESGAGERNLAALAAVPGVLSASLFELDPHVTGGLTAERSLVGGRLPAPPGFCLCEVEDAAVIERPAWRALFETPGAPAGPWGGSADLGVYRLLHFQEHGAA